MSILDVIIGSIIIALLIVGSTGLFGAVKDFLVDAENCYQANKFSMQTIEELKVLPYSDTALAASPAPGLPYDRPLDASKLKDVFSGTRSYVVADKNWATGTDPYKEITVTTTWQYKGQTKPVSLVLLRRKDY